ncbi:MAG: hypothetical protein WCO63_12960 [Bacteroidota bacterium]
MFTIKNHILQISLGIFMVCIAYIKAEAQERNFRETDEISYRLYTEQKWDSLIKFNREALKSGFDYYYLHARLGTAWFQKGNYRKSASSFEKAVQLNSGDQYSLQYLYWAYLYTGRNAEADRIALQLTPEQRAEAKIRKPKFVESLNFETGPSFSDNLKVNDKDLLIGPGKIYGEKSLYDQSKYSHLGINLRLNNWMSLYQGFSNMDITFRKDIQFNTFDSVNTLIDTSGFYHFRQNEYYARAEICPGRGWTIIPAFHYISAKAESFRFEFQWDTTWYWANPGFDTLQSLRYTYSYQYPKYKQNYSNYVLSLAVGKTLGIFNIQAYGSISDLNDLKQKILGISVSYDPFGNQRLYGFSGVSWFQSETPAFEQYSTNPVKATTSQFVFKQSLGIKVLPVLWIEANTSLGNMTNYSYNNGFIAYNIPDHIRGRDEIAILGFPINHLMLSLMYIQYRKESQTLQYTDASNYVITNRKYKNQNIIGGITWNF